MNLVYRFSRWWLRQVFLSYWQPELVNFEHVPTTGPVMLVCNHPTVLDGLVLGSVLERPVRYLISREPLKIPGVGWWLLALGFIPTGGATNQALEALKDGACIGIFPEGVPTHSYELQTFGKGASRLAERSGAPVIPVTLIGTEELCPANCRMVRGGRVRLVFGAPLRWNGPDFEEELRQRLAAPLHTREPLGSPTRHWRFRLSEAFFLPLSWCLLKLADAARPGGKR